MLQVYRGQFESIQMEEDEKIEDYFLWIDEVVNTIIGSGETIKYFRYYGQNFWERCPKDLIPKCLPWKK